MYTVRNFIFFDGVEISIGKQAVWFLTPKNIIIVLLPTQGEVILVFIFLHASLCLI